MNYAFTVTKAGVDSMPIEDIEPIEYQRVWNRWSHNGIKIVYKFKHEDSETMKRHVHYHGMITTNRKLNYKENMMEGYSIKFDKMTDQKHYDKVFNYCRHEDIENRRKIDLQLQEEREAKVYKKCIEAGKPLKQQKIKLENSNALFKLTITGNI